MRANYYITLAEVVVSDPRSKKLKIKPLGFDTGPSYIEMDGTGGWKFMQPYAPSMKMSPAEGDSLHYLRIKDEFARNFTAGSMNFPEIGDILIVLVYLHKMEYYDIDKQITEKEVIVLGQLAWHNPVINRFDNIIMDRSGAKLHFNHQWYDQTNVFTRADGKTTPSTTGHTTIVGNRFVQLSGRRFLPFGGFSHQMLDPNGKIIFPSGFALGKEIIKEREIKELFSRSIGSPPDYNVIYDPDLTKEDKLEGKFFLDPPCPDPDQDMKMHDSGWKRLIKNNADELRYKRASMGVIGNKARSLAFAPTNLEADGETAVTTGFSTNDIAIVNASLPEGSESIYEVTASGVLGRRRHVLGDGLIDEVIGGVSIQVPDTLPASVEAVKTLFDNATKKAELKKYKIYVGAAELIIDASSAGNEFIEIKVGTNALRITNNTNLLELTASNLKVNGNIEATNIEATEQLKAGTKVVTPEVGTS